MTCRILDPTKNDKIDAAEEAYYVIQDKLTAKVNADPKVKVAKEAVKAGSSRNAG